MLADIVRDAMDWSNDKITWLINATWTEKLTVGLIGLGIVVAIWYWSQSSSQPKRRKKL